MTAGRYTASLANDPSSLALCWSAMLVRCLIAVSSPGLRDRLLALGQVTDLHLEAAATDDELAAALAKASPDLLFLDDERLTGPLPSAVDTLRQGSRSDLIVLSSAEDARRAELLAAGCLAVIDASSSDGALEQSVLSVAERWRDAARARRQAEQETESAEFGDIVSKSPSMRKLLELARRVSRADSSVLILGETGVGKERLARALHAGSRRKDGPFIVVNCGAIPESLLESELFGHERGAFTGAERARRGLFECAHGGTIFLDEIGEMPQHLQVKILRVLQERQVQRLGKEGPVPVDIRVLAATNRDLQEQMELGLFRPDLYYRLAVVTLTIPPLRDRREDVELLLRQATQRLGPEIPDSPRSFSGAAAEALLAYSWPGNVRELLNVVERAMLLADGDEIVSDDLPDSIAAASLSPRAEQVARREAGPIQALDPAWFDLPLREARRALNSAFERAYLERILRATQGRIGDTARRAGMDPRSLYDKMRQYGLRKESYRVTEQKAES